MVLFESFLKGMESLEVHYITACSFGDFLGCNCKFLLGFGGHSQLLFCEETYFMNYEGLFLSSSLWGLLSDALLSL